MGILLKLILILSTHVLVTLEPAIATAVPGQGSSSQSQPQRPKPPKLSARIVQTRYGRIQGLIMPMDQHRFLKPLEVFLGVPYATPPIRSNRFSPTRTPSPWDGVRVSDHMGPVCPQKLPDISNETAALERMPRGRLEYLKRLLPYLRNQSEDCLYLNIYAPVQGKFNFIFLWVVLVLRLSAPDGMWILVCINDAVKLHFLRLLCKLPIEHCQGYLKSSFCTCLAES